MLVAGCMGTDAAWGSWLGNCRGRCHTAACTAACCLRLVHSAAASAAAASAQLTHCPGPAVQHTSASLTINENASPDVPLDLNVSAACPAATTSYAFEALAHVGCVCGAVGWDETDVQTSTPMQGDLC
jgi:hypothetical protein